MWVIVHDGGEHEDAWRYNVAVAETVDECWIFAADWITKHWLREHYDDYSLEAEFVPKISDVDLPNDTRTISLAYADAPGETDRKWHLHERDDSKSSQ